MLKPLDNLLYCSHRGIHNQASSLEEDFDTTLMHKQAKISGLKLSILFTTCRKLTLLKLASTEQIVFVYYEIFANQQTQAVSKWYGLRSTGVTLHPRS